MTKRAIKPTTKVLITHDDLDGVGCAVIFLKCFPHAKIFFTGYDEVTEVATQILLDYPEADITVTDMSFNADLAEILNARGNISLIDHHSTALWLMEKYPWAVVDISHSATKLLHAMLSNTHLLQDYQPFVDLVDNYDTWGNGKPSGPTEQAKDLSRLCFLLGQERFMHRFVLASQPTLTSPEMVLVEMDKEHEEKYLAYAETKANISTDPQGNQFAMVGAERYTSVLGNHLLKKLGVEYVIMVDLLHEKVSLRGLGNVHLGEMAKTLGGGGHARAAGFPIPNAATSLFS